LRLRSQIRFRRDEFFHAPANIVVCFACDLPTDDPRSDKKI
jgi:hypothetical protein